MGNYWAGQKAYFTGEHRVPGRKSRQMRLWVFETGFWTSVITLMILLSMSPGGDTRGVEALPWFLLSFFGLVVAFFTGGFGLSYVLDWVFPKKK